MKIFEKFRMRKSYKKIRKKDELIFLLIILVIYLYIYFFSKILYFKYSI